MMSGINSLTRRSVKLVSRYYIINSTLYIIYKQRQPKRTKNRFSPEKDCKNHFGYIKTKSLNGVGHDYHNKNSTRTGNKCGIRYSSRIIMSRIIPIRQHLSGNSLLDIIYHNAKYTWNYQYESTIYTKFISNILLVYLQHHSFLIVIFTKERI